MPSFDVVSRVDFQEIDNAIANALREITNRYDFKGSNTTLERSEKVITIVTDDDLKLSQVNDILISHFVRRKLDPLALGKKDKEKAGGDRIRQTISLVEGIEQDVAKKITSEIKSSKMKWWITFFPAIFLVVLALSINLLGDWMRDALNPKLKKR